MRKRFSRAIVLVLVLSLAGGAWADLIGHWTFDNPANLGADRSGTGNDGTVEGNATFSSDASVGRGALLLDGMDDYIRVGLGKDNMLADWTRNLTIAAWAKPESLTRTWNCFFGHTDQNNGVKFEFMASTLRFTTLGVMDYDLPVTAQAGEWLHVAAAFNDAGNLVIFYLNGQEVGRVPGGSPATRATGNYNVGYGGYWEAEQFQGLLDDVRIYNEVLSDVQIQQIMPGETGASSDPSPADGAVDVPRDVVLNWTAGETAATHDVYLGTSFSDVNDASRGNPGSTLVSQDQTDALLEYGQTYYWRIDEVNAAPDYTIFRGDVWSFTVEPLAYPITSAVTATASSNQTGMGPENAVNGSGLDDQDQHSTEATQMWMTNGTKPAWIQFEFDQVYTLHEMWVWNSNQLVESFLGFGAKTVTIEYSTDGETWAALEGVPEFAKATGAPTYTVNTTVGFGGAVAKYVKLTIEANWGGVAPQTGLAEVRFFYVPVQAFEPQPVAGATGVSVEANLEWRPGRGATSHTVYIGTDSNAVADGLVAGNTVTDHGYTPADLAFSTEYFWKVDEVGDAGTYAGSVWSFTTEEYAVVDDFESYNDDVEAETTIWHTWIDGLTDGKSGSQVGYDVSPFAEKTIIHGGKQSMPLRYNNSASPFYSEAERTFDTAQDWTVHGADTLSMYFQGISPAFAQTASGSILMNAIGTDIWDVSDQFRFAYKTLNGNGTMVARVVSLANSNAWAKGGVMIRQSTEVGSTHAFMAITPGGSGGGNGASFQHRLIAAAVSMNNDNTGAVVAAPYWVKIQRAGDAFSGFISPDDVTWTQLGTAQTITMSGPVLIGLALCSHDAAISTVAEFSDISTTGTVAGDWQVAEIGAEQPDGNSAEGIYLTVKDSSGKSKTVANTDTVATARTSWQQWKIPLTEFTSAGVKMNAVKMITIGVGNRTSPAAGGTGTLFIDDIGFGRSAQ